MNDTTPSRFEDKSSLSLILIASRIANTELLISDPTLAPAIRVVSNWYLDRVEKVEMRMEAGAGLIN
jgi:hypothetical protein